MSVKRAWEGICQLQQGPLVRVAALFAMLNMPVVEAVEAGGDIGFHWTPAAVVLAIFLFLAAGLCEIGGGWLVWQVHFVCQLIIQCCLDSS